MTALGYRWAEASSTHLCLKRKIMITLRKQKGIEGEGNHGLLELVTCNHKGHFCVS